MRTYQLFASIILCYTTLGTALEAQAGLLPTEIHYNGPEAGTDRDEFLELTNAGSSTLALEGYRLSAGLGLAFTKISLAPEEAIIVAPNPSGFRERFTGFAGRVLDASGALSNAGETLTLLDPVGNPVFSLRYDDGGDWPGSADGDGASLQLLGAGLGLSDPASWEAALPNPGQWSASHRSRDPDGDNPTLQKVPAPMSFWLLATGLPLLHALRRHRRRPQLAPEHIYASRWFPCDAAAVRIGPSSSRASSSPRRALKRRQAHVRVLYRPPTHLRCRHGIARLRAPVPQFSDECRTG